jgi:hypothetical protein
MYQIRIRRNALLGILPSCYNYRKSFKGLSKLCAVHPYLGIACDVLGIARPSAQSELFKCSYFQWQTDTKEHELNIGFYIAFNP